MYDDFSSRIISSRVSRSLHEQKGLTRVISHIENLYEPSHFQQAILLILILDQAPFVIWCLHGIISTN